MGVFLGKAPVLFNKTIAFFHIDHAQVWLNHNIRHPRVGGGIGKHQSHRVPREDLLDSGFELMGAEHLDNLGHMLCI